MSDAKRVVVGLSGGVDSAVAALLLQRQGYDVQAVFMKNWSENDFGGPCPWAEDQASAMAVAQALHIPLETWNFEAEYRDRVFAAMIHEYNAGRTPNPDILCNREIKFDIFLKQALSVAPLVATGHYARTKSGHLYKARDAEKDQSYFLSAVPSDALASVLFPLGELQKGEVRTIAKEAKLPNWDRPDSVGICFIGEKKMKEFLRGYVQAEPGPIVLPDGAVVGRHQGLPFYTIGQRHGFGTDLDQKRVAETVGAGKPLFVVAKDATRNTITIAPAEATAEIETQEFLAVEPHWINRPTAFPWSGQAKLRYRQPDVPVVVTPVDGQLQVYCPQPQRAVTPGQYAVWYDADECLGCAVVHQLVL